MIFEKADVLDNVEGNVIVDVSANVNVVVDRGDALLDVEDRVFVDLEDDIVDVDVENDVFVRFTCDVEVDFRTIVSSELS